MTWVEGQNWAFFALVKYLPICALCFKVDFGTPSFYFMYNLLYYSYVQITYKPTKKYDFFPAET